MTANLIVLPETIMNAATVSAYLNGLSDAGVELAGSVLQITAKQFDVIDARSDGLRDFQHTLMCYSMSAFHVLLASVE